MPPGARSLPARSRRATTRTADLIDPGKLLTDGGRNGGGHPVVHCLADDVLADAAGLRVPDHPGTWANPEVQHLLAATDTQVNKPVVPDPLPLVIGSTHDVPGRRSNDAFVVPAETSPPAPAARAA